MGWYLVNSSRAGLDNDLFDKMKVANGRRRFNETNGALRFWLGGGQGGGKTNEEFVVSNCMPIGAWTHVALTKSGGTVRIYVNGELVGENNAFTMGLCDANLCIGGGLWRTFVYDEPTTLPVIFSGESRCEGAFASYYCVWLDLSRRISAT